MGGPLGLAGMAIGGFWPVEAKSGVVRCGGVHVGATRE